MIAVSNAVMGQDGNQTREFFSSRLKTVRKAAGFKSARALAKVLGIDENRYTRYERAEVEPNLQLIVKICNLLETSPNELLGFAGRSSATDPIGPTTSVSGVFAPGFAEPAAQQYSREHESAGRPNLLADAAYWRLAQFLSTLELTGPDQNGGPFRSIERTSFYFREIQADPFGFAARVVDEPTVSSSSEADRRELAELLGNAIQVTVTTASPG